jgi:integrase
MLKYEKFIQEHTEVEAWLRNRPVQTRRKFAGNLRRFCEAMNVSPEEWRSLDKFEARDLAWQYIQPLISEHSSVAAGALTALKSWFRNKNGEQLPFDSGRGGKHYFHVKYKKRATEHIPNKKEMYQIVDMTSSLRDKAILLFLFQSGCRVNVLEHIKYGDVADQLDQQDTITLKITGDLDHKLRSRDIPFYYTFVNGEGAETLKQYCKLKHKRAIKDRPLFYTSGEKPISQTWILRMVKTCAKRAGFNPKTLSTHTLRKSFRKIVRQTSIDDDDKEQLMGHVIPGSREAYYDEKDTGLILKAYQKCNFTREVPESEMTKLKQQLDSEQKYRLSLEKRIDLLEEFIKKAVKPA